MSKSIVNDLYTDINGLEAKFTKSLVEPFAYMLGQAVGKHWSYKRMYNVLKGAPPTPEMIEACHIVGPMLDGQTEIQAKAVRIEAFSVNGNVAPGSVILGKTTSCKYGKCQLPFVGKVPNQLYCCEEHRKAHYREST